MKRKSIASNKIMTVLDRYEGDLAVLIEEESEQEVKVPSRWLTNIAKPDEVVVLEFHTDPQQTSKLQSEVHQLREQ